LYFDEETEWDYSERLKSTAAKIQKNRIISDLEKFRLITITR
jgi:hypothetical protein